MIENGLVLFVVAAAGYVLLSARVRAMPTWRATVTPLASIIGSGFLVSAPLLANEVGNWAIWAMAALIGVSFIIGEAVRFNIAHVEPLLTAGRQTGSQKLTIALARFSHYVLAFAYFVSVAYYLVLLGNFLLKGFGLEAEVGAQAIATAILVLLGVLGFLRGLGMVENLEEYTVGINLSAVSALLVGLLFYNGSNVITGDWNLSLLPAEVGWENIRVILGLLIVVQGFETSRFMGKEFDAALRIRTMRYAQLIAGAFYLAFFALMTVLFGQLGPATGIASIVDLVWHVAPVLPLIIIVSAVASQFSASVADSVGSAGLINDISKGRISIQSSYAIIASVAICVIWWTDIFRLVTLASQAFAFFYFVQCLIALTCIWKMKNVNYRNSKILLFLVGSVVSISVTTLGIPSGG